MEKHTRNGLGAFIVLALIFSGLVYAKTSIGPKGVDTETQWVNTTYILLNGTDITELISSAYPQQPTTYTIWKSGSTYYAKNGITGTVTTYAWADLALQAAHDASPNGGILHLSVGTFEFNSGISLTNQGITLEGEGSTSIISYTGAGDIITVGDGLAYDKNINLRNFRIEASNNSGDAIVYNMVGTEPIEIENVEVFDAGGNGFNITGSTYTITLENCYAYYCDENGVIFEANTNNAKIDGGRYRENTGSGIKIVDSAGVDIDNVNSQYNDEYGIYLYGSASGESSAITVSNVWCEYNTLSNLKAEAASGYIKGINIDGGLYTNSSTGYGIELERIANGLISGVRTGEPDNALGGMLLDTNTLDLVVIGARTLDGVTDNGVGNYVIKARDEVTGTLFLPATNQTGGIGKHAAFYSPDGVTTTLYFETLMPVEIRSIESAYIVVVETTQNGSIRWTANALWGQIGNENYNTTSDLIGGTTTAVTVNTLNQIPITALFTGISGGDLMGIEFNRFGGNAADTVDGPIYVLGVVIKYY